MQEPPFLDKTTLISIYWPKITTRIYKGSLTLTYPWVRVLIPLLMLIIDTVDSPLHRSNIGYNGCLGLHGVNWIVNWGKLEGNFGKKVNCGLVATTDHHVHIEPCNNNNNNNQCRVIQREFETVRPIMFKNPLDAGWD